MIAHAPRPHARAFAGAHSADGTGARLGRAGGMGQYFRPMPLPPNLPGRCSALRPASRR